MLTLTQLLQLTPKDILSRARSQCTVRVVKSIIDIDDKGEHKFVLANVKANDGKRVTAIKFYQLSKKNLVNSQVWVYCSCPYHKFYCEVALTRRGSSSVIESNGRFPFIRNPKMRPYLCKHLAALARTAPKVKATKTKIGSITSQEIDLMLKQIGPLIRGK